MLEIKYNYKGYMLIGAGPKLDISFAVSFQPYACMHISKVSLSTLMNFILRIIFYYTLAFVYSNSNPECK